MTLYFRISLLNDSGPFVGCYSIDRLLTITKLVYGGAVLQFLPFFGFPVHVVSKKCILQHVLVDSLPIYHDNSCHYLPHGLGFLCSHRGSNLLFHAHDCLLSKKAGLKQQLITIAKQYPGE